MQQEEGNDRHDYLQTSEPTVHGEMPPKRHIYELSHCQAAQEMP